jgi:hypothetical protein
MTGALFPNLLGPSFERMDGPLQAVHRGVTTEYKGTATVQRGHNLLARLACWVVGLPPSMSAVPVRVCIDVEGSRERWTRWFGNSGAMRSQLRASGRFLRERLGPSVTDFELEVRNGVLRWEAVRLWILGVPIPRKLFDMQALVGGQRGQYRFEIAARLSGMGLLIRYEGELDVT